MSMLLTVTHEGAGDAVVGRLVAGRPELLLQGRRPGCRVPVEGEHEGVTSRGEAEQVALRQLLQRVLRSGVRCVR